MRSTFKTLTVQKVEVRCYDSEEKQEVVIEAETSEIKPEVVLPPNHVEIERKIVDEKVEKYQLSPEEFFKHATLVE